ncbi:Sua5/YciO/YrdC/YwlC family protein [Falsiroseomonas oryzae]|uniref:Sua5/YciO/YrdC/YwlC family protein n=1 Tax=Falsiroseomonas oryzae TaxID=2766473 RepID=UPI0022EAC876|nr:Sua5/YciO/YrdC/YwlC family protein [Roseomonas sp. MO-31]
MMQPAKTAQHVLTSDVRDLASLRAEAELVHERLIAGAMAIIPLDVAYAVVGCREAAIRRLFTAKQRSYDKPSGMFGSLAWSRELHILPEERREVAEALASAGLPFSIVAPFRPDHPALRATDPFVVATSSKDGTMDMLLNAGQFHNALAEVSLARGVPVFGSSANRSLTGSRYRVADIHPEVVAAAEVVVDHGLSRWHNAEGLSSTILDFRDFAVVRRGVCFDAIAEVLRTRFGITLAP